MASNVVTAVIPKLLAQGLMALRENAVTPRLVANKASAIAGKKGSALEVPIPSAITAVSVTPAATAPNAGAVQPTTATVTLDKWYEASFDLDDDEYEQAMEGIIPMQASEAIKAIVNVVDADILSLYKSFYGWQGTAGTTPFSAIADATGARKVLNKQLAPLDNRHVLLDPDAEAAALGLTNFADSNFSGSVDAMKEGKLNRKVGMDWWMNQSIPTHTAGTLSNGTDRNVDVDGALAVGDTSMDIDDGTLTGTVVTGDIFKFAGHDQTYTVVAGGTAAANALAGITFQPAIQATVADDEKVLFYATHVANLAFHRDAIAFASRPLLPAAEGLGTLSMSQVDPISGLALRIEVVRQHKRTRWSYDFLWGADVVRAALGMRIAG